MFPERPATMFSSMLLAVATPLSAVPLIPFEILAKAPAISAAVLSPDGTRVATIETVDGRGAVHVGPLAGPRRLVLRNPDRSIDNVRWSADGRWLLVMQDSGGDEGYHLFRIDPATPGSARDLTPFAGANAEILRTPAGQAGPLLLAINRRDPEFADVYAVDPDAGTVREVLRNDAGYTEFFADASGVVRAAGRITPDGSLELWGRGEGDGHFVRLYAAPATERFKIIGIHADGRSVIVRSNRGNDIERALLIGFGGGKPRRLKGADCGSFDVDDVLQAASGPIAAACTRIASDLAPLDGDFAKAVRLARAVAPGDSLSLESRSADGQISLFYTDAGHRPGRFILVRGDKASVFAETRPELVGYAFAPTEPFRLRARDGLPLLGYVTRPLGSRGPGPTIVAVHGGPWTRDAATFERETQFYANRGYTVIQVNFRGSTGLGKRVFDGGVGEFGARMSDDVDDAVRHAVRQGWADPARVCIMGGSYGGFAALTGISREGGFAYRCAVDFAGPADLETLVRAFPPSWQPFLPRSWYRFVGNPDRPEDAARMRERSPLTHVGAMRAPLLIFQGANDPRVRQDQSDRIVCSLRARGIDVDYLLAANEGHSFANEETSLAITRATEVFFARHLGGQVGAEPPAAATRALDAFRAAGRAIEC
ncbi:S9 family peptidase [Novosphingobium sp. B1]|uniref:S9 family peptidase n=2 Tax=Alphaproteobacteria TaxID=28211 RepID=A0A2A4HUU7_9SPHN|nr:S9 family peptidase [Novosphingobium sp. B1]PCG07447.1 S9 family peptidase [Sphingomonas ginsenosidimutans]SMC30341.1 Dipeptidyl aminopeptidase/acylaminoacyl peptidase [Novosphingobium sp. B1]